MCIFLLTHLVITARQFREHKGRPRSVTPVSQGLHYNRHSIIALEPSIAPSCPGPPTHLTRGPLVIQLLPIGSGSKGFLSQEAPAGNSEVCPLEDVAFPQNPALQLPAGNTQL